MQNSLKKTLGKKSFKSFLKSSLFFLSILILEIFILTLFLDFTGLDFGHAFISTHAHLIVYLFLVIFLIIAHNDILNIKGVKKKSYSRIAALLVFNLFVVVGFYRLSKYYTVNPSVVSQNPLFYTSIWWILGLLVAFSVLFAFFDLDYIKYFIKRFFRQISFSVILSVIFLALLNYSSRLWPLFSRIVSRIVYWMLSLFFEGTLYRMDGSIPTVGIPAVAAKIYAPCSGIEGMALFLLLFTALIAMEYKNLNMKKIAFLYPLGVLGAFIVNILRTFSIFVIGHFTSPEFAIGAFHSNIGWILFTAYFLVFIYFAYPWMRRK